MLQFGDTLLKDLYLKMTNVVSTPCITRASYKHSYNYHVTLVCVHLPVQSPHPFNDLAWVKNNSLEMSRIKYSLKSRNMTGLVLYIWNNH